MTINLKTVVETHEEYALSYSDINNPGSGYDFPADKDGVRLPSNPIAEDSYQFVISNPKRFRCDGVVDLSWTFTYKVGDCRCGNEIEFHLSGHDEVCDKCYRTYNCFGQELAPQNQWEEGY